MPTIAQLPTATTVNPQDEVLLSQGGVATGATIGLLLAGTQPAVTTATGTLLGRVSLGPGGPEPVAVGTGLALATGTLAANGTDHASFPAQLSLLPTDEAVINSAGVPRRLALSLLRGLFSAGSNVAIDQNGVISAGSNLGTGSGGASLPFRAVTGTTDTPTAADRNGFIAYSTATGITVTVNDLGAGASYTVQQQGAGQITVVAGAGVTLVSDKAIPSFVSARAGAAMTVVGTGSGRVFVIGNTQ